MGEWGKMNQFLLMWSSTQGKMTQNYNENMELYFRMSAIILNYKNAYTIKDFSVAQPAPS